VTRSRPVAAGKSRFADYALFDTGVVTAGAAGQSATLLLRAEPAAIVLFTQFANVRGVSHGSFAGDLSAFVSLSTPASVPTSSSGWRISRGNRGETRVDLVTWARVTWDADSWRRLLGVPRLPDPGEDGSRAVLLGAHLDSANSPGAMDDGSGVVVLLETARVLNEDGTKPRRTSISSGREPRARALRVGRLCAGECGPSSPAVGMLQVDCLTTRSTACRRLVLEAMSYRTFGDVRLRFPRRSSAARHGSA